MEVFLVNGHRVAGRIRSFDQRCILLETVTGDQILVMHEMVSTVQPVARGARAGGGKGPPRRGAEGSTREWTPRRPVGQDREPRRSEPGDEAPYPEPQARPPAERKPVTIVRRAPKRIVRDDT